MPPERETNEAVADMQGGHALPRRSGEVVFHSEWERRAFAMAVALHERGHFDWDEFRDHLVAEIAAVGETPESPDPQAPGYFEHWLASLEKVMADKGIADA
jgi:nitrile hydratase accessory protein